METRTDEEWKQVTEAIFRKPDFEKVRKEMTGLLNGTRNRESKLAMANVSKYYFFDERTKATCGNGRPFHSILESKDEYNRIAELTFRYFGKHLQDGPDLNKRIVKWMHDVGRLFQAYGIPTQFPFSGAFRIYEKYNVNGKVFDYSCGWGNRLFAALCNRLDYTGVDTNLDLIEKLKELGADFNRVNELNLNVDVRCQGSEIRNDEWLNRFGLCFSSPPYFDVEHYLGNNTSTSRFPTYDEWLNGYLKPTISNCREYLIPGGYFIMSIKNIGRRKMYDEAFAFCEQIGFNLAGTEELKVVRRTGANNTKSQSLSASNEKMMVFQKV